MRIRAASKDGMVEVRVLMSHPMESGLRKAANGELVPAKYIKDLEASSGGKSVLQAMFSGSVSQNPFLSFKFKGAKGDKVTVKWTDNTGESRTDEVTVS
jgi:sulfur-oxidizing protein SoxZ